MSVWLAVLKSNDGLARRDAALSEGVIFWEPIFEPVDPERESVLRGRR